VAQADQPERDDAAPSAHAAADASAGSGRRERLEGLLARARELPARPGVYLMKDGRDVVVYVGKASRLRDRVSSYFVPSADLGPAKAPMLDVVEGFDTLECETEFEALLTENRLIKDIRPRFNVRLTDDKTFPYLVVTRNEDFPRVFITRNPTGAGADGVVPEHMRGARVFGPFVNAGALREAVQVAQKAFKFRDCKLDIVEGDPKNRHFRPCLLASIGRCTAPCADRVGRAAYGEQVGNFVRFMTSKRSQLLRELRAEMLKASERREYELAAEKRDQIAAVEKLGERADRRDSWQPETEIGHVDPAKGLRSLQRTLGLERPPRVLEAIDIAHLGGSETVGSKVCFVDGRPFKSEYRRYRIRSAANDDYAAIAEVVSRRYREAGEGQELFPDVILIDGGLGQLHAALGALREMPVRPPMVVGLAKKEELLYIQERAEPVRLGRENHGLRLCQRIRDEAHRFAQHYHHLLRRKRVVGE